MFYGHKSQTAINTLELPQMEHTFSLEHILTTRIQSIYHKELGMSKVYAFNTDLGGKNNIGL